MKKISLKQKQHNILHQKKAEKKRKKERKSCSNHDYRKIVGEAIIPPEIIDLDKNHEFTALNKATSPKSHRQRLQNKHPRFI